MIMMIETVEAPSAQQVENVSDSLDITEKSLLL